MQASGSVQTKCVLRKKRCLSAVDCGNPQQCSIQKRLLKSSIAGCFVSTELVRMCAWDPTPQTLGRGACHSLESACVWACIVANPHYIPFNYTSNTVCSGRSTQHASAVHTEAAHICAVHPRGCDTASPRKARTAVVHCMRCRI
jgi:hypothetical protein